MEWDVISEVAMLDVRAGQVAAFEDSFRAASPILSSMPGYLSHELHRCLESRSRYVLLVQWETVEAHTVGFRGSPQYEQWKRLLHHFYDPFPTVEHFEPVALTDHHSVQPSPSVLTPTRPDGVRPSGRRHRWSAAAVA